MSVRTSLVRALTSVLLVRNLFLTILFVVAAIHCGAQSNVGTSNGRVEILNADSWEFDDALAAGAQRLKGNVRFKHADAIMRCDSAHLYKDQRVDAYGHVAIDQGDSMHVDADRLKYDGQQRLARLEGDVRLRNGDMELTTPSLDYDLRARKAVYAQGGRIVSQREGNTLTSSAGTYLAAQRRFIFSRNVQLENPQHSIASDTMHYVTSSGVSEFFGPTTITQRQATRPGTNGTIIRTLRGAYDTRTQRARFTRRSSVESDGRLLEGDSLHYDRRTGLGEAWGNVSVADSSGDVRALGDHGRYYETEQRSMITGRAELVMRMGADTLFLHADTLFTAPDSVGRRITARRGVRFFKSDLQGVCDTLVHSDADSLIRMYHRPALWSTADQITGDHIRIQLRNGMAHTLHVDNNAFLMSAADSVHFDQVTGTTLVGHFRDNALYRLDAEGNARTVYFAREKKEGKEVVFGVNRADCSRIQVVLREGKVVGVSFLERPDAVLYPLDKAPPEELRMKGAEYRIDERPVDRADIFRR